MKHIRNPYFLSTGLAVIAGVVLRLWLLSGLNHHYYQGGTLAWHASHALAITQGKSMSVDTRFVKLLQEAQLLSDRIIDPQDIPPGFKQNPDKPWPSMDVPGYGFLLAAFWSFLPGKYIYVQIFQILLDLLAIILVAETCRRLFNRTTGGISSWLYALWPIPAIFSCLAHRDYFGIFGIVLFIFAISSFVKTNGDNPAKQRRWFWMWVAGVALGIFSWIRPMWVTLVIFQPVFLWIYMGWAKAWRSFLVLSSSVIVLFFLPLSLMNMKIHGRPFVSPVGLSLWQSLGEDKNPYGFAASDLEAWQYAALVKGIPADSLNVPEANDILLARVIEVARMDPGFVLTSLARRGFRVITLGYSSFLFLPFEKGMVFWSWPFTLIRYLHKLAWLLAISGFLLAGNYFGYRKTALLWAPPLAIFLTFWPTRFADPRFFFVSLVIFVFFLSAGVWVVQRRTMEIFKRRIGFSHHDQNNP